MTIKAKTIPLWRHKGKTYRAISFKEIKNPDSFVEAEYRTIQAIQVKSDNLIHFIIHGSMWQTIEREIVPDHAITEIKTKGKTLWKSNVIVTAKEKYGLKPMK